MGLHRPGLTMRQIHIDEITTHAPSWPRDGTICTRATHKLVAALTERGWLNRMGNELKVIESYFLYVFYRDKTATVIHENWLNGFPHYCEVEIVIDKELEKPSEPPRPFNRWDYVDLD